MKGRRGFTLIELLVVIAIIAILAAILFPVFAKARKSAQTANCQSNMNQIGKAIKTYLTDWDETYPTNRLYGNTSTYANWEVPLSRIGIGPDNKPYRGDYGTCWVEGLYQYMEPITDMNDASSVWKCQAATVAPFGATSAARVTAAVSYVMNFNLIEQPESIIRYAANLMLMREVDLLVASSTRAGSRVNNTNATPVMGSSPTPTSPFLSQVDRYMTGAPGVRNPKLHGTGSNILFADGHVKLINASQFQNSAYSFFGVNDEKVWANQDKTVHCSP